MGLYGFFLSQTSDFTETEELKDSVQKLAALVSQKYGEPLRIHETFKMFGQLPKNFLNRVLHPDLDKSRDPPEDDDSALEFYRSDSDSVWVKLGYYIDYNQIPKTVTTGPKGS